MKNNGRSDYSIRFVDKSLTYISKHANLNQPEQVKQFIANLQTSNGYKRNLALKDESGQELDCLVIAIAQTKKVIQVKDEQGKFSCPTRQATGLHRGTYEEILQSKTSVLYDNYNFISNLSAFLDGR